MDNVQTAVIASSITFNASARSSTTPIPLLENFRPLEWKTWIWIRSRNGLRLFLTS